MILYINATRCHGKYQHIILQYPQALVIIIYYEQSGRVRLISSYGSFQNLTSFLVKWYGVKCKSMFEKYPEAKWIYDGVVYT